MAEYFYRETEGGPGRAMGPFETLDEAKRAARYKGLRNVEVVKKSGTGYETVEAPAGAAGAPKSGAATGTGRTV